MLKALPPGTARSTVSSDVGTRLTIPPPSTVIITAPLPRSGIAAPNARPASEIARQTDRARQKRKLSCVLGQYTRRALWLDFRVNHAKFLGFCIDNAEMLAGRRRIYALVTPK